LSKTIDYYVYSGSPFSYLGHQAIIDVAQKHGTEVNYKPVFLPGLWKNSGAVIPAERPLVRQHYRLIELQRIAHFRGLLINIKPKYWPVDASLADLCAIAIVATGQDPAEFMSRIFKGMWVDEADMSSAEEISARLADCGHNAEDILAFANSEKAESIRQTNTNEAIAFNAVGVPAYVLDGEVFWGQDRIEYIDHALSSGRSAITG